MKKNFLNVLTDKCKDMGLSEKTVQEIAEQYSDGLTEETSDEDFNSSVNRAISTAKTIQAEATRWAQKAKESTKTEVNGGTSGNNKTELPNALEEWQKRIEQQVTELKTENEQLKTEKTRSERSASIVAKANQLGIPAHLMKRFHIEEGEDVTQVLTEYKQELVTNKLMPESSAGVFGNSEGITKDEAEAWAKGLPDVK